MQPKKNRLLWEGEQRIDGVDTKDLLSVSRKGEPEMERVSGTVNDELYSLLEEIGDYHDIPMSRVIELLLREGVNAREQRCKLEQLDAKLDVMINRFGVDIDDEISERKKQVSGYPLVDGTTGADIDTKNEPHPFFQLTGVVDPGWEDELVNFEPVDKSDEAEQK